MDQKHRKSLPNGRQQEPQGGGAKRRPLGAAPKAPPCCLRFGKDFLCFGIISGAHSGSILAKLFGYSTCRIPHCSQFGVLAMVVWWHVFRFWLNFWLPSRWHTSECGQLRFRPPLVAKIFGYSTGRIVLPGRQGICGLR